MANYTATKVVNIYNTVEEAVAGLETMLEATAVTRLNLKYDVIQIRPDKYAAWICHTAEA